MHRAFVGPPVIGPSRGSAAATGLAALLTVWAFIFVNGYTFGDEDQLGILPMFRALTEPGLYAQDWYVQAERAMSVRHYYLLLLRVVAAPLGTAAASYLLFMACGAALFAALERLARPFVDDRAAARLAAFVGFMTPAAMGLGHSRLVNNQMLPNLGAYALVAWALVWALNDRPLRAGAAIGIATLAQGLVGVEGAVLVALTGMVVHGSSWRRRWRAWLCGVLVGGLAAAPNLWLVLTARPPGEVPPDGALDFQIYARLRLAIHVLPESWPAHAWLAGGVMLAVICLGGAALRRLRSRAYWAPVLILAAALACGYGFIEWAPSTLAAKLQLFRAMTLVRVYFALALVAAIWTIAKGRPGWRAVLAGAAAWICMDERLGAGIVDHIRRFEFDHAFGATAIVAVAVAVAVRWAAPAPAANREGREAARPSFNYSKFARSVGVGPVFVALCAVTFGLTPRTDGTPLYFPASAAGVIWRQCRAANPAGLPRSAPQRAAHWAGRNLPDDAVVLIAPYFEDFRYRSGRAVVVDFKAVPFTTVGLRQWQQRLFDVCGVDPRLIREPAWPDPYLTFATLDGSRLAEIADRHGAAYLAIDRAVDGPWLLIHQDNATRIYRRTATPPTGAST